MGSDFYPEDGWELLKFDNGFLAASTEDDPKPRRTAKTFLYFCYYNKHRGIMRFFGMMPSQTQYQLIRFQIQIPQFKKKISGNTFDYETQPLSATNILSIQGNAVQPLDQETEEVFLEVLTAFPGGSPSEHWFWFDVPVAYDPCVCKNDIAIAMTAQLEKTFDIELKGWLNGEIIQKTEAVNSSSDYRKMVASRIISAGIATGVAIGTNGAVINVSAFTGLIDIYKNKPGVSPQNKSAMEAFQQMANNSANFFYDDKAGKWRSYVTNDSLSNKDWIEMMAGINKFMTGMHQIGSPSNASKGTTTSVLGSIEATGQGTTFSPTNSQIYWGLPGSKMSKTLDEQTREMPENQTAEYYDPEYPLFNEVLGTFALLKTPKVNVVESDIELCTGFTLEIIQPGFPPQLIPGHRIHNKVDFNLSESLLYHFNPLTNVNLNKTKISVAYVYTGSIQETLKKSPQNSTLTECFEPWELEMAKIKPINLSWNIINTELISPIVPINQFKNLVVRFVNRSDVSHLADSLFIRFFIEYESNDLDYWDEEPIRNNQVFTFPVEIENVPQLQAPLIDVVREDNGHHFNTPTFFTSAVDEFFNGLVTISSHLSYSGPGIKTIYSLVGFDLKPGAYINSNIKLVIGYPLPKHEQPMQTSSFVESFCNNQISGLEYKAKDFAPAAILRMQEERDRRIMEQMIEEKQESTFVNAKAYPNPNNGEFNLLFDQAIHSNAYITLYDLTGRVVHSQVASAGSTSQKITTNGLTSGIYMVTITQNNERQSFKIVID